MNIQIQSIHFDADKALLEFIKKKLDKLNTIHDKIIDIQVYLKINNKAQKDNKDVEVKLNLNQQVIFANHSGISFEEATDLVLDTLKLQLKKYKEKQVLNS